MYVIVCNFPITLQFKQQKNSFERKICWCKSARMVINLKQASCLCFLVCYHDQGPRLIYFSRIIQVHKCKCCNLELVM